jgi:PIN domain
VIALLDASVLYPAPLRDLLMHLAQTTLFKARWSNLIHDEWTRNVLEDRPDLSAAQISRTRALMDAHVDGALVTDFEDLIPNLELPDLDDRHVLAAAIRCGANLIVTMNEPQTLSNQGIGSAWTRADSPRCVCHAFARDGFGLGVNCHQKATDRFNQTTIDCKRTARGF